MGGEACPVQTGGDKLRGSRSCAMLEEEAVLETAGYKLEEEAEEADRAAVSMVKEGAIRRSELSSLTLLLGIILLFPFSRRYFLGLLCLVEVLTYSPKTSF